MGFCPEQIVSICNIYAFTHLEGSRQLVDFVIRDSWGAEEVDNEQPHLVLRSAGFRILQDV